MSQQQEETFQPDTFIGRASRNAATGKNGK